MEIINEVRTAWFEALLRQRLDAAFDQQTALRVEKTAQEIGAYATLRTLDAIDDLETPEPPASVVAGYGLYIFYSGLITQGNDRME